MSCVESVSSVESHLDLQPRNARVLSLQPDEKLAVFNGILADEEWRNKLQLHLQKTHEAESVMFLQQARELLRSLLAQPAGCNLDEATGQQVHSVVLGYVLPGASHAVCLSSPTLRDIMSAYDLFAHSADHAALEQALSRCVAEVALDLRFSGGYMTFVQNHKTELIGELL